MIKRVAVALMLVLLVVSAVMALPANQAEARVVVYLLADASCSSGVGALTVFINDHTGEVVGASYGCVYM